jgi:antitoxin component of MazEF toxin-antitoxin module
MTTINIRQRRQVTLPAKLLKQLSVGVGDQLVMSVQDNALVAKPTKNVVVHALDAVQQALEKAGVSEKELQAEGSKVRQQLVSNLYDQKK